MNFESLDDLENRLGQLFITEDKLAAVSAFLDQFDQPRATKFMSAYDGNTVDSSLKPQITYDEKALVSLLIQHGISSNDVMKPEQSSSFVLVRAPCAFNNPAENIVCSEDGTKKCSRCRLVLYCSLECQKKHWSQHKKCKQNPAEASHLNTNSNHVIYQINMQGQAGREKLGAGLGERAATSYLDVVRGTRYQECGSIIDGSSLHRWGNVPAMDVLNFGLNKRLAEYPALNILFAASGDLRNAIQTVVALPATFTGELTIVLNDRDPFVSLRNVALLQLLGSGKDPQRAANLALHCWYSAFVPGECHTEVSTILLDILTEQAGMGGSECRILRRNLGSRSSLEVYADNESNLDTLTLKILRAPQMYSVNDAVNEIARVRFDDSRADLHDRVYSKLEPSHRLSFETFRKSGLVLPVGAYDAQFNIPNYTLFHPTGKWILGDGQRPLFGWDIEDVIASGVAHGTTREDVYGCLYFHVSSLLCDFVQRLSRFTIKFKVLNIDALDLPQRIRNNELESFGLPANTRFDRIDVSNIMDANYAGIDKVVAGWGSLLRRSKTSALLGYFMNWMMDNTVSPESANASVLNEMKKSGRFPIEPLKANPMAGITQMAAAMEDSVAYSDTTSAFERHLSKHGMARSLRQAQLKIRDNHSILPHRLCLPIEARKSAKPAHELTDENWYLQAHLGGFTWNERFVEIVCDI